MYPLQPGNSSGSPRMSWKLSLGRGISGFLFGTCCLHDPTMNKWKKMEILCCLFDVTWCFLLCCFSVYFSLFNFFHYFVPAALIFCTVHFLPWQPKFPTCGTKDYLIHRHRNNSKQGGRAPVPPIFLKCPFRPLHFHLTSSPSAAFIRRHDEQIHPTWLIGEKSH